MKQAETGSSVTIFLLHRIQQLKCRRRMKVIVSKDDRANIFHGVGGR